MAVRDRVEESSAPKRKVRRALVTWRDLAHLLSVAFVAIILYADFADPGRMESSDYVSSFYVAGHLAAAGEFDRLYPGPDATSFRDTPFNDLAHQLLPQLPEQSTTAFLYPPIVAWIFAPLSLPPPHISLLLWQMISVAALGLSCLLLGRTSAVRARDLLLLSALFLPTFITVLIGQAAILFGLLPLSIGYWLLSRGSPLAAGFAWAALALKPQFLPAAGMMSVAYAVTGRMHLLAGMILGLCGWLSLNYLLVPDGTLAAWIRSLRSSDAIFSSGEYGVPVHMLASIPADVMMRFPPDARASLKPVLYGCSVSLGLFALWRCRQILRSPLPSGLSRLAVFSTCVAILPLTSPHLLYYDLVTLFPMGLVLLDEEWRKPPVDGLRRMILVFWLSISAYMLVFTFAGHFSPSSLILLVILLTVWTLFVQKAVNVPAMAIETAADRSSR